MMHRTGPRGAPLQVEEVETRLIAPTDPEWPAKLDQLGPEAPRSLHAAGRRLDPTREVVAVVGSRNATMAGIEAAEEITAGLAQAGFVVVSGMARGIDGVAHRVALEEGGTTIGVLGCGIDVVYPPQHASLRRRMLDHGTLVSEHPAGTPPHARHFPERNRIIAGMARAVVVVEGALKSGALITAQKALDADRDVFAVPGSIRNAVATGTNELIRRSGAGLVTNVNDLFEELAPDLAWRQPLDLKGMKRAAELDAEERTVLLLLDDAPVTPDRLAGVATLDPGLIRFVLSKLEIRGLATRRPAGYVISGSGAAARRATLASEAVAKD